MNKEESITKEKLLSISHLPLNIACSTLGIEVGELKKLCRKCGIKRWPYNARKEMKKIEKTSKYHGAAKDSCYYEYFGFYNTKRNVRVLIKPNAILITPQLPSFSDFIKNIK